ncbi:MAG TPA: hypothetical protein VFL42_01510, partial [Terriglobales bacterium]|nr:hypothetical protein [Terriglobales bacterium]
ERQHKTEADKEKLDFLLVQYFAHCAPQGISENQLTLDDVARVLEPALGKVPQGYPEWAGALDEKLQRMNACNSLEEVQNSGALLEVRELKLAVGDEYFQPGFLVAFTRFNFRARRAFFKAMHLDLHAIRSSINQLEQLGHTTLDCREAGLTESESLDQVRHVVHQWKTPFRAPYSGGSSFLQLILLRHILEHTLEQAGTQAKRAADSVVVDHDPQDFLEAAQAGMVAEQQPAQPVREVPIAGEPEIVEPAAIMETVVAQDHELAANFAEGAEAPVSAVQPISPVAIKQNTVPAAVPVANGPAPEEDDYLSRCVADIAKQLVTVAPKTTPSVSAITLAGCKLLIATWEAEAFTKPQGEMSLALQRTVAARTILHVCMDRQRRGEETDLALALDLARQQTQAMDVQVNLAKEAQDIDAAVNLAATTKRLQSLIEEGERLLVK